MIINMNVLLQLLIGNDLDLKDTNNRFMQSSAVSDGFPYWGLHS